MIHPRTVSFSASQILKLLLGRGIPHCPKEDLVDTLPRIKYSLPGRVGNS